MRTFSFITFMALATALQLGALGLAAPLAHANHASFSVSVVGMDGGVHVDRAVVRADGRRMTVPRAWINPAVTGRLRFTAQSRTGSLQRVIFPGLGNRWLPSELRADTAAPFHSIHRFAVAAVEPSGLQEVIGYTTAPGGRLHPSARFVLVRHDADPPAGGALEVRQDASSHPVISMDTGTDAASGLLRDSTQLQRRRGAWIQGECQFEKTWDNVGPTGIRGTFADVVIQPGACHRYRIVVVDRVFNTAAFYSDTITRALEPVAPPADSVTPGTATDTGLTDTTTAPELAGVVVAYGAGLQRSAAVPVAAHGLPGGALASVYRRHADMLDSACGSFGDWSHVGVYGAGFVDTVPASGCYQYQVRVSGPSGVSIWQTPNAVARVDTVAPTGTVEHPSGTFARPDLPLTVRATDGQTGVVESLLEQRSAPYTRGVCGDWSIWRAGASDTEQPVDAGHCYEYRAYVEDRAGNVALVKGAGTVQVMAPDATPPAPFDAYLWTGQSLPMITSGAVSPSCAMGIGVDAASLYLRWQASSDAESGIAGYRIYLDGKAAGEVGAAVREYLSAEPLSVGPHTWEVRAHNWLGVETTGAAATDTLVADATTPAVISSTVTEQGLVRWEGADDACVARVVIYVDSRIVGIASGDERSYQLPALSPGSHSVRVRVIDGFHRGALGAPLQLVVA